MWLRGAALLLLLALLQLALCAEDYYKVTKPSWSRDLVWRACLPLGQWLTLSSARFLVLKSRRQRRR